MARLRSGKIRIGNLIKKLEDDNGLPNGTLKIVQPNGRNARQDISLSTFRKIYGAE